MYQAFNFIAISATLVIDDQNNVSDFTVAPRNSRSGGALVSLLDCEQPKRSLNDSYLFQLQQRCSKDQWELVQPGQLLVNLFSWLYLYKLCLYGVCTDFIHQFLLGNLQILCYYLIEFFRKNVSKAMSLRLSVKYDRQESRQ